MEQEKKYDFLKRMAVVHQPNRRDDGLLPEPDEVVLESGWRIVYEVGASPLVVRAAYDFQDYLSVSMGVEVSVIAEECPVSQAKTLLLRIDSGVELPRGGFRCQVSQGKGVVLAACDERGIWAGTLHWEDVMNLREAPYLKLGESERRPLVRMRSVHSGCGFDDFPDWQLNAIAHGGFTAIDLFVRAPNQSAVGDCDINDLIDRANSFGLDVMLYSYLSSYKHPDDADAEEFFDSVYGEIFRRHPGFAGIHLVGESLEFPSKDPHTSGQRWNESVRDGIPDTRPSPGWYPCYDYPDYIKRIVEAVHKVKPEAEVILNTYNWGWAPAELREEFLRRLPKEITIQTTYDIFKFNDVEGLSCPTMDYSISAADPGYYFTSEVEAAKAAGVQHIRVTSNLAGMTWDFGCVPYVPVFQRWRHRMEVLKEYVQKSPVDSFYDNHHYGWWPCVCNDLEKEIFASDGAVDLDEFLYRCAVRDYGRQAAETVVKVWGQWSDAMDFYVGSNEDQYGPWRVGPAYPFIFQPNISRTMSAKEISFPTSDNAIFGGRIVKTFYTPYENINQSPGPLRYPRELRKLSKMETQWREANDLLESALPLMDERKRENGERLLNLGKFMLCFIRTTMNIKAWWLLNMKLQNQTEREPMLGILDEIEALAQKEIANVKSAMPLVAQDSRLGWEPSMEYVCDPWHLEWKLRQMESALREVDAYRKMVRL